LRKLVADEGGEAFLNGAVNFANNAPRVKAMFDKAGVKPETLKDNVMKELQNSQPRPMQTGSPSANSASSSLERLKKLR